MSRSPSIEDDSSAYVELLSRLKEVATLGSIRATLSWDQETMMPPRAAAFRAEEMALLASLEHDRATDPRIGELLSECESEPALRSDAVSAANLREIRRDYDRALRLPTSLVAEISRTTSQAIEVWKDARSRSRFETFRPWLERIVSLNVRKAQCYSAPEGGELYDALLEDYEPGIRVREIEDIFGPLRKELAPLFSAVSQAPRMPDPAPLRIAVPIPLQQQLNRFIAERVGFDFSAGRLDVSTHPFTEGLAPGDTRITTRYSEDRFLDALGSTLHETGHALYEQGLPKETRHGQPLAQAAGVGLHESQSRLWENQVGRCHEFWRWALPEARRIVGAPLESLTVDGVWSAVNRVEPSLIRVESDETTYSLHVMLRFDLERALVRGDLAPADVPGAWNERIKKDLGLDVPDDSRGCLQDIHWSAGAIGYFPTYTLGSLYAAQLWEAIRAAIPGLEGQISRGDFAPLLAWLREYVHAHGRRYRAAELCGRLTGRPLSHEPLVRHLASKLRPIYGI